jgi:cytochrome c peroxidase
VGGFFLDGRASTLQEQAKGPFLNPLEMGNPDEGTLAKKIRQQPYATSLAAIYGKEVWTDNDAAIAAVTDAITHYENSSDFAPFSSKYDAYLRGETRLSKQEMRGLELFENEKKGNCAACHPSARGDDGAMPLFTDFSYDNIGAPANTNVHPEADPGLGNTAYANKQDERGKFKVPSLRNIARTAPYIHNGVFKNLRETVAFYNSRDTSKKWGKPDVEANVNKDELGNLKLKESDIDDIVAFLKTLDDGYKNPTRNQE